MPIHGPAKRRQVVCLTTPQWAWLRKQSLARGLGISDVVRRLIDAQMVTK